MSIYFKENGLHIAGFFSSDLNHAGECASYTNSKAFESLRELVDGSDLIVISSKDWQISEKAQSIAKLGLDHSGKYFMHLSGQKKSSELKPLGENILSLHPLMSFPDYKVDLSKIKQAYFFYEGSPSAMDMIKDLLKGLPNRLVEIDPLKKDLYHASAVFVSNFNSALIQIAVENMQILGINKKEAQSALMPLLASSYDNILALGYEQALTGPVKRGDAQTVASHLKALEGNALLYKLLSEKLLEIDGVDKKPFEGILEV